MVGSTEENSEIDDASGVRDEDRFDVEAVRTWLAGQGTELTGEIDVRQFGGGASNLTYSLRDGEHDLILRRPPSGQKAKGAHDMGREYRIQDGLAGTFPLVPEMVALCQDESVIGSEFYVMKRVDGIIPRRDFPEGVTLEEEKTRALCTNALDVLIDLHQIDVDSTPLASMNKGDGYVERQISGWSRAVPGRPHRGHRRLRDGDGVARGAPARGRRQLPDPQRLPVRQPGALAGGLRAAGRRARLGDGDRRRPADGPRRDDGLLGAGRRRRVLPPVPAPAHQPARACSRATRWWPTTASAPATP